MKKFLKYLSPFAPDDSGACSVLYELGGIVIICDAGGCAGNVCGFDEPRWFTKRSALFSAGLRDMDAILGRDKLLIDKLKMVTDDIDASFTAIVGTPVPAVIATDYKALKKMAEKKTELPCIVLDTDGTKLYDEGEEKAYFELFREFAVEKLPVSKGKIGILGVTPLTTGLIQADSINNSYLNKGYKEAVSFGMDSSLDDIKNASGFEKIIVISPSGLKAAEYLKDKFGTPYEIDYPEECIEEMLGEDISSIKEYINRENVKTLIIHQQFAANKLREMLDAPDSTVASFFKMEKEYISGEDTALSGEDDLDKLIYEGGFELIIADRCIRRALPDFKGKFITFDHFAVSGKPELL